MGSKTPRTAGVKPFIQPEHPFMARPRKSAEDKRDRWDALYVTAPQRAEIAAAARAAGQSVSQYLLAAHEGIARRPMHDRAGLLQAVVQAEKHLAVLAQSITANTAPIDAVMLQANLLAIERGFRLAVLPWAVAIDGTQEGRPSC